MLDKLVEMLLCEVDVEKDLFHDLCVYERGIKPIPTLLRVINSITNDVYRNGVLLTLFCSLLQSFIKRSDFGEDILDLRPVFDDPSFVILSVVTKNEDEVYLGHIVHKRHNLLTKELEMIMQAFSFEYVFQYR